jgi:uncharacterized protein YceH (UPF0502 family)
MLGALIEKGLATPQNYPLTLNSLAAACNQTTNRDPITDLSEADLQRELDEAKGAGLARFVHPRSGRGVTKFKHVVDEAFELEPDELALIGVLLLRGPQTVSELRARTERLAPMADNAAVESVLHGLAQREPTPLTRRLEREPGSREPRWIQLLCPSQGVDGHHPAATPAPPESAGTPDTASPTPARPDSDAVSALQAEVAELRLEVRDLREVVDRLRSDLGA